MAVLANEPVGGAPAVLRARFSPTRFVAWHPEWWVHAVAFVAALGLVAMALGAGPAVGGHVHGEHVHGSHVHGSHGGLATSADVPAFWPSWSGSWTHWALMVGAMMLPVVAPQVRGIALRSLRSRRQRAAVGFVIGYAAVWLAVGAVLLAVLVVSGVQEHAAHFLAVTLLLAAAWQVSDPRRRVLRRCAPLRLGAASGVAADVDCARLGVRSGLRCAVTCGPVMVAMALSHSLLLMTGLMVVMLSERTRGPDPLRRAGRPLEAWVIAGFGLVAAGVAALQ